MHGNTHIPVATGALHRHRITGEPIFRLLAANFLEVVSGAWEVGSGAWEMGSGVWEVGSGA